MVDNIVVSVAVFKSVAGPGMTKSIVQQTLTEFITSCSTELKKFRGHQVNMPVPGLYGREW